MKELCKFVSETLITVQIVIQYLYYSILCSLGGRTIKYSSFESLCSLKWATLILQHGQTITEDE
jgi:hypothetical protein